MQLDLTIIAALAPIIVAVVQIAKAFIGNEATANKWAAVISVASGIVLAIAYSLAWPTAGVVWTQCLATAGFNGLIAGLSAAGLYSAGAKPLINAISGKSTENQ
jgi:hypothetical protein